MSGIARIRIKILPLFLLCCLPVYAKPTDTLTPSKSLIVGQTLISRSGIFELGFFQRGTPTKYYVGIWYKDLPSKVIVWVANRDSPSYSDSCTLLLGNKSNIVLTNGESQTVWKTNKSSGVNTVLQLLDSGNLVIREAGDPSPDNYIWQSFDHPTDTLLPGQKVGLNLKAGSDRHLVSWVSPNEPGTGNYTVSVDYRGGQEIYLRNVDQQILHRSGPYNGMSFGGVPELKSGKQGFDLTFVSSVEEVYYMNVLLGKNVKTRSMVSFCGVINNYIWVAETNRWSKFWYSRMDRCENYALCGPNGVCNPTDVNICKCLQGFKPKNSDNWSLNDWSDGCVRETKLDCESDGFLLLNNMKLPDTLNAFVDKTKNLVQCRELCKKNCSCLAYANYALVKDFGPHCVIWTSDLYDMRTFVANGHQVYVRSSASELAQLGSSIPNHSAKDNKVAMGIGACIAAPILAAGLTALIIWKRSNLKNIRSRELNTAVATNADDMELALYNFDSMAAATDNFSEANKLTHGGFGCVYKGAMLDGQVVAVKRLPTGSRRGSEEFKNEVRLIAKLHHRNLVRFLGYCVGLDEKMLIYEYLENRSLDSILFNEKRIPELTWSTRFNIICGVARGLLYLHQDSRYGIIHRDLNPSNILLDAYMNPKISGFSMARIFGRDEVAGNTMSVVGTYGYMAPELAMDGVFSIKSDVFSFGVIVLEILSGTKNRGFSSDNELNLLGYAWEKWNEAEATELVDKSIGSIYSIDEVLSCLQVGLLCVQQRPEDRPTMGSVILMLSSESASLPRPKLPGYWMGWNPSVRDHSSGMQDDSVCVNQLTVTLTEPR